MNELRDLLERRPAERHELPPFVATFLRGLSLGALVGAAIAGSAIWRRVRDGHDGEGAAPSEAREGAATSPDRR